MLTSFTPPDGGMRQLCERMTVYIITGEGTLKVAVNHIRIQEPIGGETLLGRKEAVPCPQYTTWRGFNLEVGTHIAHT